MTIKWRNRTQAKTVLDLAPQNPHQTCEADLCFKQGKLRCDICKDQNEAFGRFCSEDCLTHHVHYADELEGHLRAAPNAFLSASGEKVVLFGPVASFEPSEDPTMRLKLNRGFNHVNFISANARRNIQPGAHHSRDINAVLEDTGEQASFGTHDRARGLGAILHAADFLPAALQLYDKPKHTPSPGCTVCGKRGKMFQCTRCQWSEYCSAECQGSVWSDHKIACKQITPLRNPRTHCHINSKLLSASSIFQPLLYQWIEDYRPLLIWIALQPFLSVTQRRAMQPDSGELDMSVLSLPNSVIRLNLHFAPKARTSTEAKAAFTLSSMTQEQLPQLVERWSVSKSRAAQMVTAAAKSRKRGGGHACIGLVVRLTEDCEAFFPIPLVDRPVMEELKIMQPAGSSKGAETLVGQVVDEMRGMDYPFEEPMKTQMQARYAKYLELTAST